MSPGAPCRSPGVSAGAESSLTGPPGSVRPGQPGLLAIPRETFVGVSKAKSRASARGRRAGAPVTHSPLHAGLEGNSGR